MDFVTDTVDGVIWGLRFFTEDGDPVLHHSTFAKEGGKYGIREFQVVPREVFQERFLSGRDTDITRETDTPEQGYLPGYACKRNGEPYDE